MVCQPFWIVSMVTGAVNYGIYHFLVYLTQCLSHDNFFFSKNHDFGQNVATVSDLNFTHTNTQMVHSIPSHCM